MIVEVNTIDEFCHELTIDSQSVVGGIVRHRVDRLPEQDDAISFQVGLWITTVVDAQQAAYILQVFCPAGSTDDDADDLIEKWTQQLQSTCDTLDLTLRHGKIEQY